MLMDKNELVDLYNKGNSLQDIALLKKCSVHKIRYWINKYNIKKRSRSEALYLKYNPNGNPYITPPIPLLNNPDFLFGLSLGLYWGEGNKTTPYAIRITNTDPGVILIFRKFLLENCHIPDEKIKYSVVAFQDRKEQAIRDYWSKTLQVHKNKFGKIVRISQRGKGTYKRKSDFGVCTLTVCNVKLKSWFTETLQTMKAWVV